MMEHIPLLMGLATFLGGVATWYAGAVKKSYASERDFGHLKRNYEGLSANIATMDKMLDDRLDRIEIQLAKMEALEVSTLARMGVDTAKVWTPKE